MKKKQKKKTLYYHIEMPSFKFYVVVNVDMALIVICNYKYTL